MSIIALGQLFSGETCDSSLPDKNIVPNKHVGRTILQTLINIYCQIIIQEGRFNKYKRRKI